MTLVAVPNISEGRDERFVQDAVSGISEAGGKVLDVHSDARHNRSVLTLVASDDSLVPPIVTLASICRKIDLRDHDGVHPRLGALDVCPVVPFRAPMERAVFAAREVAQAVAEACDLPVYLYGRAAEREVTRDLPAIRKGGLEGVIRRSVDIPPDFGPKAIDPAHGVVCVGARGPLIAFNVWLRAAPEVAEVIARRVREPASGLAGVRALGMDLGGVSQVSMNLTEPERAGIDAVFDLVSDIARSLGEEPWKTEIVGLIEKRFAPDPEKKAARLLIQPGRDLESAISVS
jgi:glutamate formiminotransferase